MNNRELLEYAAKAAGIDERRLPPAWPNRFDVDQWNPLIDDTDALRLAVKLGLSVNVWHEAKNVYVDFASAEEYVLEIFDDDPYTATRRAIVRAAAEIGKEQA